MNTATPWHVAEIDGRPVIRGGELNLIVAALILLIGPGQSSKANAEFIVRACNAHEALVEYFRATEALQATMGHPEATTDDERRAEERFEKATSAVRAELRKAGANN